MIPAYQGNIRGKHPVYINDLNKRNIFDMRAWNFLRSVFFVAPHRAIFPGVRILYAALLALSLISNKFPLAEALAAPAPGAANRIASLSAQDREVLAARDAFDKRDIKTLDAARARLNAGNHPLTPYANYWWLSANLAQAGAFGVAEASQIRSFLDANADTPYADNLRRDWLKILGALESWELFTAALPKLAIEDSEVTCHHWRYRLSRNDLEAFTEAKAFWTSAKATTDNCYSVFLALQQSQRLSNDEVWLRVRRLLENGAINDARRSANFLNPAPKGFEPATAIITQDPARYLGREKLDVKSRASIELFLFAITRFARTDAERAAALMEKNGNKLPAADNAWAWAQIGLYGSRQQASDALKWFQRAGSSTLSDQQAAWKARAALRAADWTTLNETINAMSPREQHEPAWRYWQARAYSASQLPAQLDAAKALKETLARENNFYGLLAAEELGVAPMPDWTGINANTADLELMRTRPAIQRTLALYRLGMKEEGLREWQYATRNLNDRQLLIAAELARENDIPDRAISAADRTLMIHDFSRRYPIPYRDDLQTSARTQSLDQAWIYGLIRQESRFMADARSPVGAMGLMQLMPTTARWAARQVGLKPFAPERTIEIPVNLSLGSFYLRHVLDNLGHPVLATAAYNAGPSRARRWQADTPLEGAIYAECIPFNETRDYVKKVMTNAWFYARRLGTGKPSLKELMGTVPARGNNSANNAVAASTLPSEPPLPAMSLSPATPSVSPALPPDLNIHEHK